VLQDLGKNRGDRPPANGPAHILVKPVNYKDKPLAVLRHQPGTFAEQPVQIHLAVLDRGLLLAGAAQGLQMSVHVTQEGH
jgi:hypothetical protein